MWRVRFVRILSFMNAKRREATTVSLDAVVGRNVHVIMWERKMTQTALGGMIGTDQSSLGKKLRGERGWSLDEVEQVAAALAVPVSALFDRAWYTPRDLNPEPTDSRIAPVISIDFARSLREPMSGGTAA